MALSRRYCIRPSASRSTSHMQVYYWIMPRRTDASHRRPDYGLPREKKWTKLEFDRVYWAAFGVLMRKRGLTRSYALREYIRTQVEDAKKSGELK